MKKLIFTLVFFKAIICIAQVGTLDKSFGNGGKVITDIVGLGYSVVIQKDGKIILFGSNGNYGEVDFAMVRFKADGTIDSSFGTDGQVRTMMGSGPNIGQSLALQKDGKIVAAGVNVTGGDFALARYNTNGSLDNDFGNAGKVITDFGSTGDGGYSVAIQADDKIVLAGVTTNGGYSDFAIARYKTNGALDSSFGTNGTIKTGVGTTNDFATSLAIQDDGKLVVVGYSNNGKINDFATVRYKTNGTLDSSFGNNGKVITTVGSVDNRGYSVAIDNDGKILLTGGVVNTSPNWDIGLVRYNRNGTLDTVFGNKGKVSMDIGNYNDEGHTVMPLKNGKIIVGGLISTASDKIDFGAFRFNNNGKLDSTFGLNGGVTTDFVTYSDMGLCAALKGEGLIVAGYSRKGGIQTYFSLLRYQACFNSSSSEIKANCNSYNWRNKTFTKSGVYRDTILNSECCDSILTLNLTITRVDTSIKKSGNSLSSNAITGSYQWMDCNLNKTIPGETNKNFIATKNGKYAVIVTQNSCVDTSECYAIQSIDITKNAFRDIISVYPNPTGKNINIDLGQPYKTIKIVIKNTMGQTVLDTYYEKTDKIIIDVKVIPGVYFLEIKAEEDNIAIVKFLKK